MKRLLLLSSCSVGVMTLLALGFSRGLLSPRELGIAIVMLGGGVGTWAVLIMKRSAREFKLPPGTSIDDVTRKRRLLGIRAGKVAIAVLAVLLLVRLRGIGSDPLLPLLVTIAINLCIMAAVIQVVVRLQKSLH